MTDKEYQQIKDRVGVIMKKTKEPLHSFQHGERVAKNAEKIAEIMNLKDKIDVNLLKVCGLVHDIPISSHGFTLFHHFFEPLFVRNDMPRILSNLELSDLEKKIVLTATINHVYSYPYRRLNKNKDVYSKALQDADTLDLFSPERQETFKNNINFSFSYREMNIFARLFFGFGKKYLAWYLNYPEIAQHIDEFYKN